MTDPELANHVTKQSRALVRAIEALGTIEPSGPIERAIAGLLLAAYRRRRDGRVELTFRRLPVELGL